MSSNQTNDVAVFHKGEWVNLRLANSGEVKYPSGVTFFPPNTVEGWQFWSVYV